MPETTLSKTAKSLILDVLKRLRIINDTFTGKLTINFNEGGLTVIEKTEKFK